MTSMLQEQRFDFESCEPQTVSLGPGKYELEVVGAAGGDGGGPGGLGGRSIGLLSLKETTNLFVHIGEKGETVTSFALPTKKACNGGGMAKTYLKAGSGGGSTDIRIGSDSLMHRVIVAGGGGGGGEQSRQQGGSGGGVAEGDGTGKSGGRGAKGASCSSECLDGLYCPPGQLLYGGNAQDGSDPYSGGGGGLFGGAASKSNYGGGGGSGFVFTQATNDPAATSLDPKYFLTNASTNSFSNSGHGYAIIRTVSTSIDREPLCRTLILQHVGLHLATMLQLLAAAL